MVGMERQAWKVRGGFLLLTLLLHRTFLRLGNLTNATTATRVLDAMEVLSYLPPRPGAIWAAPLLPNSLYHYHSQAPNTTMTGTDGTNIDEEVESSLDHSKEGHKISVLSPSSSLNGLNIRIPDEYEYLLNVPFYMYEEWGAPSYPNATLTLGGKPVDINALDPEIHVHSVNELKSKHSDDIYLIAAAVHHPMRTRDPSQAKLFLVPTPFNLLVDTIDQKKEKLCFNEHNSTHVVERCNQDWVRHVDDGLANSPWYQRNNGRDHIAILSHWRWRLFRPGRFGADKWTPQHVYKCQIIDFERKVGRVLHRKHRITFPSYYVGKPCPRVTMGASSLSLANNKTHDFSMVATLDPIGRPKAVFQDRINVCDWIRQRQQQQQPNASGFAMEACGLGTQCPALASSRFVIHARGDTDGSNRPMDALLSHTIPIFTRPNQYKVLPHWINWDTISYFADVSNQTNFVQDLEQITNDDETYQQKQRNVIQNTDLFDYNTVVPLDTYLYMFQSTIFPETKRENLTSPYNALLLP